MYAKVIGVRFHLNQKAVYLSWLNKVNHAINSIAAHAHIHWADSSKHFQNRPFFRFLAPCIHFATGKLFTHSQGCLAPRNLNESFPRQPDVAAIAAWVKADTFVAMVSGKRAIRIVQLNRAGLQQRRHSDVNEAKRVMAMSQARLAQPLFFVFSSSLAISRCRIPTSSDRQTDTPQAGFNSPRRSGMHSAWACRAPHRALSRTPHKVAG